MQPHELASRGEDAAAAFLERRGYTIVERNWTCKAGEVDIVALDGTDIVFVEVKTRASESCGTPEEAVDERKQRQLRALAPIYLSSNGLADVSVRFDVVGIRYLGDERALLRHHRAAFGL